MGGGSKSKTELPQWYVDYAKPSLELANKVAQIGYRPNVGPELAAFNDTQKDVMNQGNAWNAAFNTPGQAPQDVNSQLMPTNSSFMGQGAYSSFPQYQESMDEFNRMFPGQAKAISDMSVDPQTGAPAPAYSMFPPYTAPPDTTGGGGGGGSPGAPTNLSPEEQRRRNQRNGGNMGGGR